jgi:ketosteroid isomerase-like protein
MAIAQSFSPCAHPAVLGGRGLKRLGAAKVGTYPARDTARAMSQENVETFRRGVQASNTGDVDRLLKTLDPAVEWYPAVVALTASVYRGHEGVRAMLSESDEVFASRTFEETEIHDLGDRLLVFGRMRARGLESGADTVVSFNQLIRFKDGKAIEIRTFLERDDALEAAGVSE